MQEAQTVKKNSDPFADWKAAIDLNARLLDCLYRLSFHKLNQDDFDYLMSQLEKTPNAIIVYSRRIKVGKKKERFLDKKN